MGESHYKTTYHISIGLNPFRALYGNDAPIFIDMALGDNMASMARYWLQESQDIPRILKENLQIAQNWQKVHAYRHRVECSFQEGGIVCLRLQPYRQ